MKRLCVNLLLAIIFTGAYFFLSSFIFATESTASSIDHRLVNEEKISEGTHLLHYDLDVNDSILPASKLSVDLHNPHVDIQAMHPKDGFNNRQTVRGMADEQDAVAAVNADFFHLDRPAAPFGLHVEEGEIISSPLYNSSWLGFGIDKDNTAYILNWFFDSKIICDGEDYPLHAFNNTYQNDDHIFLYDRRWGERVSSDFFEDSVLQVTVENGTVTGINESEGSVSVPRNGAVLIAEGKGADFLEQRAEVGSEIEFVFDLDPPMSLETSVGGHVVLVDNGLPADSDRLPSPGSTRASRTAVGIDEHGKEVYFVTVDATSSSGITMEELAAFMSSLGMDRALNLDGGGSTTMVARGLGEFEPVLVSQPRQLFERSLPNAIGIFNRAPKTDAERLFLRGEEGLLKGTEASYEVSGHDKHYHPLDIAPENLEWEVSDKELAEVTDGILKAKNSGEVNLLASYQGVTEEKTVQVFGGEHIDDFSVTPDEIRLLPGQNISLEVEVDIVTGLTLEAGPETVDWEADIGYVEDNTYYASEEEGFGTLTAQIDGHTKEIPVRIGGKREPLDIFREEGATSFRSHPDGLDGNFEIEKDLGYVYRGERSGKLDYDFSKDIEGVMIAYAQFDSGEVSMGTNNLGVSAYIYGDNSGYWLRAEVFDADGNRHYVDLEDTLDWEGWRRVQGEFDPGWAQPLKLSSIYLVQEPEKRTDDYPESGTIYIDNVEMIKGLAAEDEKKSESTHDLEMWVGSTEYRVEGELNYMDAEPFIENGRTFVPIRFIGKAFDAEADWTSNPETGRTEKVTLEDEEMLITVTVGEYDLVILDKSSNEEITFEMDVSPKIINGRTYLPFRAIGEEGFGVDVGYKSDPSTNLVDSVWFNR